MNEATQLRNRASQIAKSRPVEALKIARGIADPWFRCQALSAAAAYLTDQRSRMRALKDALSAANELTEPNRVVTVSAWPVKVLVTSGQIFLVFSETERLIQLIAQEPSPVRRSDALQYLLGAVSTAPAAVAGRVAREFADACLAPLNNGKRNSRGESNLELCLPGIARIDHDLAVSLLDRLTPSRSERASRRLLGQKGVSIAELLPWPNVD